MTEMLLVSDDLRVEDEAAWSPPAPTWPRLLDPSQHPGARGDSSASQDQVALKDSSSDKYPQSLGTQWRTPSMNYFIRKYLLKYFLGIFFFENIFWKYWFFFFFEISSTNVLVCPHLGWQPGRGLVDDVLQQLEYCHGFDGSVGWSAGSAGSPGTRHGHHVGWVLGEGCSKYLKKDYHHHFHYHLYYYYHNHYLSQVVGIRRRNGITTQRHLHQRQS